MKYRNNKAEHAVQSYAAGIGGQVERGRGAWGLVRPGGHGEGAGGIRDACIEL